MIEMVRVFDLRQLQSSATLKIMSKLETIVEELKALPQERLDRAAGYIHRLRTISEAERKAIIDRTAGSLTAAEADELERIVNEGCERIDE
jgi:hypothetical protein